jgi:Protein of unknown function (DUF2934)
MIITKVKKQPKQNRVTVVEPSAATETTTLGIGVSQDAIRERAFQVYQSRGSKPGLDIQDWLHAEHQILER